MLAKLKNTVKHSAIYSLGNLSAKLVGFILLPIYFHYLTIEEYGIFSILEVTAQIIMEVLLISIPTAMMRWYSYEDNEEKRKSIVFTSFVFIIFIAIVSNLVLIPFAGNLSELLFSTLKYSEHFIILFLYISISMINRMILNLIRVKKKSVFFVVLSLIRFTAILIFNIYFVAILGLGIKGILLGLLIGQVLLVVLSIKFVFENTIFKFNFSILKEMLGYGFPLIFSTISTMVLNLGDRYLIKYFLGDAAVGIYSAGFKIASLVNVFINHPFQMGFLPIAFSQVGKPGSKRFFAKVLTYKTLLLVFVVIVLTFFSGNILTLISNKSEYLSAIPLIPIIGFVFIFKGIQYVMGLSFHYVNRTKFNAYIVIFGALINVGLNIWLIPQIEIIAAPISMIISLILMSFLTYYFAQKEFYIPYETRKIITLILIGVLYYFVSFQLQEFSFGITIFLKLVLLLLFPFILFATNFFEVIELQKIKGSAKKWRNPKMWKDNFQQIKFK
ncbi:MAG: oligosaccharide flippase family protein [Melioribacteraceae bacterium]